MSLLIEIRRQLSQRNLYQITKYLGVSIAMYVSIFIVMYVAVDIVGLSETMAYIATYAFAYVADYLINLRYLFYRDHSWPTVIKYVCHIVFFLGCGTFIFKIIISADVHYLIATLLTAMALLPMRFLAHKFIVFR